MCFLHNRPLVCRRVTPRSQVQHAKFLGHFSVDKTRRRPPVEEFVCLLAGFWLFWCIFFVCILNVILSIYQKNVILSKYHSFLFNQFCLIFYARGMRYPHLIVLNQTQSNMKWPWNGDWCRKIFKFHQVNYSRSNVASSISKHHVMIDSLFIVQG